MNHHSAPVLMVQGTMSGVGKSAIVTGLCRILARRGARVAPFKAWNMSNNAAVTADGGEIGRSTFVQTRAAGIEPTVRMNPLLLKPEPGGRAQVVVLGKVWRHRRAGDADGGAWDLWPIVAESLDQLRASYDIVVAEGSGSPAELNLRDGDLANMRVARYADAKVILVGDVERGGVFAQLLGTLDLLPPDERALVCGLIVNRFRGDRALFAEGVRILEERSGLPVFGVVPRVPDLDLPEEDSVALDERATRGVHGFAPPLSASEQATRAARASAPRIAVIRLPYIANFDDFAPLEREGLIVDYVDRPGDLDAADLIVLPGSKATVADLDFLHRRDLAEAILRARDRGVPILGICGGFQQLGREVRDPERVEADRVVTPGLGLLSHVTAFGTPKRTGPVEARVIAAVGPFAAARGARVQGYEIHHGRTLVPPEAQPQFAILSRSGAPAEGSDGLVSDDGLVAGTYLHGLFENAALRQALAAWLRARPRATARMDSDAPLPRANPVDPYDRWADVLEATLDVSRILRVAGVGGKDD